LCFFFSSRRRHTSSDRDWSSDVCSSDLFVKETREQGATPIICSLTPRKNWTGDGHFRRDNAKHAAWAAEVAKSTGTTFVDLYEKIGRASCRERVLRLVSCV